MNSFGVISPMSKLSCLHCRVLVEDLDLVVDLEVLVVVHLLVQASLRFLPS